MRLFDNTWKNASLTCQAMKSLGHVPTIVTSFYMETFYANSDVKLSSQRHFTTDYNRLMTVRIRQKAANNQIYSKPLSQVFTSQLRTFAFKIM